MPPANRRVSKGLILSMLLSVGMCGWLHLQATSANSSLQQQITKLEKLVHRNENFQSGQQTDLTAVQRALTEIEATLDDHTNTLAIMSKSHETDSSPNELAARLHDLEAADQNRADRAAHQKAKAIADENRADRAKAIADERRAERTPHHKATAIEAATADTEVLPVVGQADNDPSPPAHQEATTKSQLPSSRSRLAVLMLVQPESDVSGSLRAIQQALGSHRKWADSAAGRAAGGTPGTTLYLAAATDKPLARYSMPGVVELELVHNAKPRGPLDIAYDPAAGVCACT